MLSPRWPGASACAHAPGWACCRPSPLVWLVLTRVGAPDLLGSALMLLAGVGWLGRLLAAWSALDNRYAGTTAGNFVCTTAVALIVGGRRTLHAERSIPARCPPGSVERKTGLDAIGLLSRSPRFPARWPRAWAMQICGTARCRAWNSQHDADPGPPLPASRFPLAESVSCRADRRGSSRAVGGSAV